MRICIDARSLRDVPTSLAATPPISSATSPSSDRENEYIVIRRPSRHGPIADQANFREIFSPHDISSAHNIARVINALDADVYHSLFHFLPVGVRARRVVITLHDLIWVDHPHLADGRRWRRWVKGSLGSFGIRRAIVAADHIVAVSASTRQAALDHGVPADKVTAVLHGVAPAWHSDNSEPAPFDLGHATDQDRVQRDILAGLVERPFAFGLGNSLPYKNLPRLVHAFAQVAPDHPDLAFVFAGRGEGNPALVRLAQQLGLSDRVLLAGQLSDEQIRACFAHALFFAFPSLIEGFGLPVLEAMASGCPVLTSNCSSLAEIAGEDAVLVDPLDTAAIAAGMQRLLTDSRSANGYRTKDDSEPRPSRGKTRPSELFNYTSSYSRRAVDVASGPFHIWVDLPRVVNYH